jgi:hypothetical protein
MLSVINQDERPFVLSTPRLKGSKTSSNWRNFKAFPSRRGVLGLPFFGEHCDLFIRTKMAWLMRLGERKILFAGQHRAFALGNGMRRWPVVMALWTAVYGSLDRKIDPPRRLLEVSFADATNPSLCVPNFLRHSCGFLTKRALRERIDNQLRPFRE